MRVNGEAVRSLAAACACRGIALAHFSTDYVVDGESARPYREDDAPAPHSVYGASKLAGERGVRESGAEHLVLRTQWLFGEAGRSFPRTMWERARRGEPTRVVGDQWGRPTWTRDLAAATWRLLAGPARGILHVTSSGAPTTWYDVARAVFDAAGAPSLLSRCTTEEYPTPARRPAYGVLDTTRLESEIGISMMPWREALERFVGGLGAG
jgi:dTDP-4-dehydrorhamnose reductase